ncbi:MAG: hypothetical protein FWE44_06635 [Defluviitaleaceae bacterium]|nr:hypothetical protein [Defluviitaleaceae bacterium]
MRDIANSAVEILNSIDFDDWDLDCIDLFSHVVASADDYRPLFVRTTGVLTSYKKDFEEKRQLDNISANLYVNMILRAMQDYFHEIKSPTASNDKLKNLKDLIVANFNCLLLVSKNGTRFRYRVAAASIRYGIVFNDIYETMEGFETLIKANQKEIIKLTLKEVEDYALQNWKDDFQNTFADAIEFSGYGK